MKAANILIVGLAAGALTGCGAYDYARNVVAPKPGHSVEFVSGSTVLGVDRFRQRLEPAS